MKIDERTPAGPPPAAAPVAAAAHGPEAEDRTRVRVCREVLEQGPVSAAQLAHTLGLTSAGIRRHLDVLVEQGLIAVRGPASSGHRGRGRPARLFVLTDAGHAAMSTGYDDLAAQVLRYLTAVGGPDAVLGFARERQAGFEARYRSAVDAAGPDPLARAQALAAALSGDGYAASTRTLSDGVAGLQLCQGHCPVQHVAREFPQLCEAETDTFSRLLGVHVQRLATLAHGEHVCTTHVPGPQALALTPRSTERIDER